MPNLNKPLQLPVTVISVEAVLNTDRALSLSQELEVQLDGTSEEDLSNQNKLKFEFTGPSRKTEGREGESATNSHSDGN